MSEAVVVTIGSEPSAPPGLEPGVEPPKVPVEGEGQEPKVEAPRGPDGKFLPKWVMPRIDELTGQKKDLQRELESERALRVALENRLKDPAATPVPAPAPGFSQADVEQRAAVLSAQQRDAERFNTAAQEVITKGRGDFQDFDNVLGNFAALGGLNTDAGRTMLQAALDTGQGHKVLYNLAQNLDEAQRVLALPPTKMAIELDRMATKMVATPPRSKAPEPIEPITGRVAQATDAPQETDSVGEWIRKRNAQLARKTK